MKYKYIGKNKYWNEDRSEQIVPGQIVELKLLGDKYYEKYVKESETKNKKKEENK